MDRDSSVRLQEAVQEAAATGQPLALRGGGSKSFLTGRAVGRALALTDHRGIVNYEPKELVLTARAGTPLAEVEAVLAAAGQQLPFEPPHFGAATLGGTIACGLSGPGRPFAGSARDFVLGTRVLTGDGAIQRFGGEVMKNVAGYDVSRLMVGAMGTLGVLLEVSLKVLPRPADEVTLAFDCSAEAGLERLRRWQAQPLPLTGGCHDGERLYLRIAGAASAVQAARQKLGGEPLRDGVEFWHQVREQQHPFFQSSAPLWRLAVPAEMAPLRLEGEQFIDWAGGLRWFKGRTDPATIRQVAEAAGGHATLFRGAAPGDPVFHPLPPLLFTLHQRLKAAFDPHRILNPGALYAAL